MTSGEASAFESEDQVVAALCNKESKTARSIVAPLTANLNEDIRAPVEDMVETSPKTSDEKKTKAPETVVLDVLQPSVDSNPKVEKRAEAREVIVIKADDEIENNDSDDSDDADKAASGSPIDRGLEIRMKVAIKISAKSV